MCKYKYSISVLTFSALDRARRCIASVLANSPVGEYELLLTANGPLALPFFTELSRLHPNVRVISNDKNLGFIFPNLHALEIAKGEMFCCLNDDTEVPAGWLEKLRAPFDSDPMMGLTAPSGGCCTIDRNFQGKLAMYDRPIAPQIEYIEAACVMGQTELLRKVGMFAPELKFAYWEDTELSLRLRELGYKLAHVPFRITHQRAATSRNMPEIRQYQAMNGQYFRKRHAGYLRARRFDYVTVIKRNAAHGDVLLTTPIIRALKERNPKSPIWVETICGEVLRGNPHIERVGPKLPIPGDAWVVELDSSYEATPQTHIVAAYAAAACVREYSCRPEIFPQDADHAFARAQLDGDGIFERVKLDDRHDWIAVHPGPTSWSGKTWDMARWAELIPKLPGRVVLVGNTPTPALPCALDLRGKTTIGQMAAVIARCRLMVTLDSLPLHVAQAVGTPVVGLFGITSPEFIVTDGSPAIAVCSDRQNPSTGLRHRVKGATMVEDHHACMATITVEAVYLAAKEMLPRAASLSVRSEVCEIHSPTISNPP